MIGCVPVVQAIVASEIEVRVADLPPMALELIKTACSFKNEERQKNASLQIFGWWDLPEYESLWRIERRRGGDEVLCLPRGFGAQLAVGLAGMDVQIQWDDRRASAPSEPGYFRPFLLRDYQVEFVAGLIAAEQGLGMAPAGAGKSNAMLGLMMMTQQRTLVIVDKEALLEQWRSRAAKFMGLSLDYDDDRSVGKIGADVWQERDLTIALRQTLWSRNWETKATDWFSRFGLTVLDEVQHLSGESLRSIVRDIPSKMIFGVSATPSRTEIQGQITAVLVGPIVAETKRADLYERGVLMKPVVRVVETDLEVDFWPDHDVAAGEDCMVPNCRKSGQHHRHRNNYSSCLKALVENKARNKMIADGIVRERGHVHLVPSRQLKHLDQLRKAIEKAGWDGPIYMLRGEENARGESQDIAQAIERDHEAVILSTVADEGLDIPAIDRIWLSFPMRQTAAVIQLVGRCERISDGKTDAVIVDICDSKTSVFGEQHQERLKTFECRDTTWSAPSRRTFLPRLLDDQKR